MASCLIPWFILWSMSYAQVTSLAINGVTAPQIVSLNLTAANRCIAPDGFPRVAVLAGKQGEEPTLPGPIISGTKGDRFLINVTNELTDTDSFTGTTFHWHGIHQIHSNQMDGTAFVTQCPISPGDSFLYNFTADGQVGTYWYHSHYQVQYCDGLRGAFIIRDPDDPFKNLYDYDNDSTVITLMDWYHYPSVVTPRQIWPDSALINGTGCYNGLECPPTATYMVEANKSYRFRLLNMACKTYFNFTIDNHNLTIIEVDGGYVEPYTVDSIQIFAGQRYSFILNADKQVDNYWIRTNPTEPVNATTTAILRYIGASNVEPRTISAPQNKLNESLLRTYNELPARLLQPNPDVRVNVVLSKDSVSYNFKINDVQYISPSVPVLLQIMNGVLSPELQPTQSIYMLPKDKVIEVTFHVDDTPGRPHPFHLHGHTFAVIKTSDGQYINYDQPVTRDTVTTGMDAKADNVTIRFITDNPGPWILHCHVEWHLYAGMAIVFVEDYAGIPADQPLNNASELCPYYNPTETWALPPPRSTEGPWFPTSAYTCQPTSTPYWKRGG